MGFFRRININYEIESEERLENNIELALYRVLTELINNTIKHAEAKNIHIELTNDSGETHIIYSDDGIGFDVNKTLSGKSGYGLLNLQNRIRVINGTLNIYSEKDKGVRVEITTPFLTQETNNELQ